MDSIKNVAVLGSGVMGVDIALFFALHGFPVLLWHRTDQNIARTRLDTRIQKYREKEILSVEQSETIGTSIKTTQNIREVVDCDLVIESIVEDRVEKSKILKQISDLAPETVLTTNTSSLSIDELAADIPVPSCFAGLHFFNPVLRLELVEIVAGSNTSDEIIRLLRQVCERIEKTAVTVKDSPGFVVNRLMACQIREAILAFEEGVAEAEDIDTAVKLGLAHQIGPLALADLIGLDVILVIFDSLSGKLGARFEPPECLKRKVAEKMLGRKTGQGFYGY